MKAEEEKINPRHLQTRNFLRVLGPCLLGIGLVFEVIGMSSFFSSFGSFDGPPKYFWCCFVGGPFIFFGLVLSKFAYMGKMARYVAAESAPVAKDSFNYMATGTKDGVKEIFGAIRDGLDGDTSTEVECPDCQHRNDIDAKYCDQCGSSMNKSKQCVACHEENDLQARFCNGCGAKV